MLFSVVHCVNTNVTPVTLQLQYHHIQLRLLLLAHAERNPLLAVMEMLEPQRKNSEKLFSSFYFFLPVGQMF